MVIGKRFRDLRLIYKMTQERVAQELDIAVDLVSKYEMGDIVPTTDVINCMADTFNVSADYLLGRTDDPTPPAHHSELSPNEQAILAALRRDDPLTAIKLIVQTHDKPNSNLPN